MNTRILLADDHQIIRQGLKALLEGQENFEIAAEAGDGRNAVKLARELQPQVVVMDVGMPDLNGVEATRQVINQVPGVKVVVLSAHGEQKTVREALRAGASGYLMKDMAFEELVTAINTVLSGKIYLSPNVAGAVVDGYLRPGNGDGNGNGNHTAEEPNAFARLTPREREVLQLMAEGKSTKQIAMALHVSVKTVETHRRQLMEKLDLHSVAELTKYAIREGLTSLA